MSIFFHSRPLVSLLRRDFFFCLRLWFLLAFLEVEGVKVTSLSGDVEGERSLKSSSSLGR